jgi:hypothetical protein
MVMVRNLHLTNGNRQTPYKKNKTSRWDRSFACKEIVVVTKKSLSCVTSLYSLGYHQTGMNPEKWKKSTIVPIQKVSGTKKLQEFRPINILPAYLFADDTLLYIAADTLN